MRVRWAANESRPRTRSIHNGHEILCAGEGERRWHAVAQPEKGQIDTVEVRTSENGRRWRTGGGGRRRGVGCHKRLKPIFKIFTERIPEEYLSVAYIF